MRLVQDIIADREAALVAQREADAQLAKFDKELLAVQALVAEALKPAHLKTPTVTPLNDRG